MNTGAALNNWFTKTKTAGDSVNNEEIIRKKISQKKPGPEDHYNLFSVFLPLVEVDKQLHVLFEVRAENLDEQPGEICFPGGRIEKGETPLESAVRETLEELRISHNQVRIFGPLNYIITPYNIIIYPFAGRLIDVDVNKINFNRDEVSEVFTVPLEYLLRHKPQVYFVDVRNEPRRDFPFSLIRNGKNYRWKTGSYPVLFYTYGRHTIWGLTARILKIFLDTISS